MQFFHLVLKVKISSNTMPSTNTTMPINRTTSNYFGPSTRARKRSHQKVASNSDKLSAQVSGSIASKVAIEKEIQSQEKRSFSKVKVEVVWEPNNWRLQFENIRKMRKQKDAPVDIMGCERCTREGYSEKEKRYHILVSLMLSSQTKDQVTHAAMDRLLDHGLTVKNILDLSEEKLGKLIYPVGFWKKKVTYLKNTAAILNKEYDDDIPGTVKDLVKLPGVGPKMAYLAMNCAWDQVVGIGVDVHVHRISNRLNWVRKKTKEAEQTRKELESWMPQDMWKEANWLLVGFGQQICLPVSPKCSGCLNKDICPASTARTKVKQVKIEA